MIAFGLKECPHHLMVPRQGNAMASFIASTPSSIILRNDDAFNTTGNPGSVVVAQYGSSKITVFVWGKNTILKFVGNTKYKSMKLTLQLVVVVLIAPTKFRDNLFKFTLYAFHLTQLFPRNSNSNRK